MLEEKLNYFYFSLPNIFYSAITQKLVEKYATKNKMEKVL